MVKKIDPKERQARIVIISICIVIAAFLLVWFYVKSLDSFSYGGVSFQKVAVGEITVFQSKDFFFPAYRLNFRVDPRENNIPIKGDVVIKDNIVVTSSQELRNCEGIAKAYGDIIIFLVFADGNVSEATTNMTEAIQKNGTYENCASSLTGKTVIKMELGNENSIVKDDTYESCYKLTIKDCNGLDALSERFIMAAVANYNNKSI